MAHKARIRVVVVVVAELMGKDTLGDFESFPVDVRCYDDVASTGICVLPEGISDVEMGSWPQQLADGVDLGHDLIDSQPLEVGA